MDKRWYTEDEKTEDEKTGKKTYVKRGKCKGCPHIEHVAGLCTHQYAGGRCRCRSVKGNTYLPLPSIGEE